MGESEKGGFVRKIYLTVASAIAAVGLATPVCAANVIDQSDTVDNTLMARFFQTDLAQSFEPSTNNASGAGIYFVPGVGPATITISLYTDLPNQSDAHLLASGTAAVDGAGGGWVDTFWSPVSVTANTLYYLVFTSTNSSLGIAGDTTNAYGRGQTYANAGYGSFPPYDYTFRTYTNDGILSGVPEPATWAMMLIGFAGMGLAIRRRRGAAPQLA